MFPYATDLQQKETQKSVSTLFIHQVGEAVNVTVKKKVEKRWDVVILTPP